MSDRRIYGPAILGLVWGLSACSMMPEVQRPEPPVPAVFPGQSEQAGPAGERLTWSRFVTDPRLQQLIAQALEHNRDLQVAAARVEQWRAQFQIRQAEQWPALSLGASGSRQPTASGNVNTQVSVGLVMASWELDFWGRVASLKAAARAQFLASTEAQHAVQASIVAGVASQWLNWQAHHALRDLAARTLSTRETALHLVQLRHQHGVASALDLRQAESLVAAARATLAQQTRAEAEDLNALGLLLGGVPPSADGLAQGADRDQGLVPGMGSPFAEIPAGLPSELLVHRPDIRQSEQMLVASHAHIGAARAAFFPRISLTAAFGSISSDLSGLFAGGTWGASVAPQAVWSLWDAGRNQASLEVAEASRTEMVAQYEKTIQVAFREVADALVGRSTWLSQREALDQQEAAERERERLAALRYRSGVSSHLEWLDAQRSWLAVRQAQVLAQLGQWQNQVALYRALGGGWVQD